MLPTVVLTNKQSRQRLAKSVLNVFISCHWLSGLKDNGWLGLRPIICLFWDGISGFQGLQAYFRSGALIVSIRWGCGFSLV